MAYNSHNEAKLPATWAVHLLFFSGFVCAGRGACPCRLEFWAIDTKIYVYGFRTCCSLARYLPSITAVAFLANGHE